MYLASFNDTSNSREIMEKDKSYVICVSVFHRHHADVSLVKCCKCGDKVWCSTWNLDKVPICVECVKKHAPKDTKVKVTPRDILAALKEIKRRNDDKVL